MFYKPLNIRLTKYLDTNDHLHYNNMGDLMLKEIITKENLIENAKLLKKKSFRPGFDGMSAEGAVSWIHINGDRLCSDVLSGDYFPMPAIGFRTAKNSGGYRQLSKLTALDTVLQNTVCHAITNLLEDIFSDSSFAYRPNRGVTAALERYVYLAQKHRFAAKLDFTSCFCNIDHTVLEKCLNENLNDLSLSELIMKFVRTPISIDNEIMPTEKGLLQGMPLAPVLCNLYLHSADCYLEEKNIPFVRYADDIVIFGSAYEEIQLMFNQVADYFKKKLLLNCNADKCIIAPPAKIKFLGHKFECDRKGMIAFKSENRDIASYHNWDARKPYNNRKRVNIISDGILRQKDFSIMFDTDAQDSNIPAGSTEIINLFSNVIFDAGFFNVAAKNGIIVNLFDKNGKRLGCFLPSEKLKSPPVTHEQLMSYYDTPKRLYLAMEFVLASIHNCVLNIRYYNKQHETAEYKSALSKLSNLKKKIKETENYSDLLLLEAQVRNIYYGCFDLFINKEDFTFEKRTHRPPQNEVNALISFGNTLLYTLIASEINKTALDVRVGFLHATNSRKESLNLDIAEIFKPLVVDRTIFSLINKGALQSEHFETGKTAVFLNAEGKRIFMRAFYDKLNTTITVKDKTVSYNSIITEEIRKLIRHFKNGEKFKAFRQVR